MATSGVDYMRERAVAFQALRKRLTARYFVPGMALFLIAIAGSLLAIPESVQIVVFLVGFILMTVGAIKYRCPSCDRTPRDGDGIDFNPKSCGNCGAILRWPNEV